MVKSTKKSTKKSTRDTKKKSSQNSDEKLLFWVILSVVLLIIFAISLTYAYFSRNVSQIGEDPDTTVITGKLDVNFLTTEYISNTNAFLINDEEAYKSVDKTKFSVTRSVDNTVEKVYYTLKLIDINITDNLISPYLKWRLYETQDISADTKPLKEGDFSNITNNSIELYNTKIPLPKDVTHDFTLIIWLSNDDEVNQTSLLDGTIRGKVEVTAVNS